LRHDFPQWFHFFSQPHVAFKGRDFLSTNRNFLGQLGADGIKTGFICDSGFNLVASVNRNGQHLIGVVLGASNGGDRLNRMMKALERGFSAQQLDSSGIVVTTTPGKGIGEPVRMGSSMCNGGVSKLLAKRAKSGKRGIIDTEGNLPGWGTLLGVFKTKKLALRRARTASSHIKDIVKDSVIAVLPRHFERGISWKTLLVGMTKKESGRVCRRLWRKKILCTTRAPKVMNSPGFAKR